MTDPTVLTELGQYGSTGVAVATVIALIIIILAFLYHLTQQSKLNREAMQNESKLNRTSHSQNTQVMTGALNEVTKVVSKLHGNNLKDHLDIKHQNESILREVIK